MASIPKTGDRFRMRLLPVIQQYGDPATSSGLALLCRVLLSSSSDWIFLAALDLD